MALGSKAPRSTHLFVRGGLFAAWCMSVAFFAANHVFWRDEVRAFSIALSGKSVGEMLAGLRGEGHPAIWYLLLRGAHSISGAREALPAVAAMVAAAASALLAFRSPFRPAVIALILFGAFALHEYAVMARNYGISMLLLFAFVDRYPEWRDRGILLGVLLALLCNTNVHSVILAAGLLVFWFAEITSEEGLAWTRKHRLFLANAAIAGLGVAACLITVYPSVHDAVAPARPLAHPVREFLVALWPGGSFSTLPTPLLPATPLGDLFGSVLLLGAILGLLQRPGALLSSLFVLVVFSLLFRFVYPGSYRHETLFLVYLVAAYWLVLGGRGGGWPARCRLGRRAAGAAAAGAGTFILLLALQVLVSATIVGAALRGVPESRVRDLAAFLERRQLSDAILIADPDVLLEPLPYYAPNDTYLLREQRFGSVVRFTRGARLHLTLDALLKDARALQAASGRPIVILLQHRLDTKTLPPVVHHTYVQTFSATEESIARFDTATSKLASFAPAQSDESYDLYLLLPPRPQGTTLTGTAPGRPDRAQRPIR